MAIEQKIKRHLTTWVAEGLITSEQARAIESYEGNQSGRNLLFWMAWLAGSSIVLGIIALIASNWAHIPPAAKLFGYFLGFAGAISVLIKTFADKPLASEILRLALMGYTMAGIGLVAQIYHLHSAPYRGVFFWCAITLGLALACTTYLGAFAWISMLCLGIGMLLETMKYESQTNALILVALVSVFGIGGSLPKRKSWPAAFPDIAFTLATSCVLLFSLIGLYWIKGVAWATLPVLASTMIALALWASTIGLNSQLARVTRMTFSGFIVFAAAQAMLIYNQQNLGDISLGIQALSILLFTAGTLSLALSAFSFGKKRIFETLLIVVILRLFFVYAEHLFSAMMGGIGLIFFGLLILAAIYAWQKLRTRLFTKLEGIFHVEK